MFTVIGVMLGGMLIGFLLRRQEFSWIGKVITLLIWALLFLGCDMKSDDFTGLFCKTGISLFLFDPDEQKASLPDCLIAKHLDHQDCIQAPCPDHIQDSRAF